MKEALRIAINLSVSWLFVQLWIGTEAPSPLRWHLWSARLRINGDAAKLARRRSQTARSFVLPFSFSLYYCDDARRTAIVNLKWNLLPVALHSREFFLCCNLELVTDQLKLKLACIVFSDPRVDNPFL